jgi:uncharacterized membrane protein
MKKVFISGESYMWHTVHVKGADTMATSGYTENVRWLRAAIESGGYEVTYMPIHKTMADFPDTVEKLNEYDLVILSDIGSNSLLMTDTSFPGGVKALNRCEAIKNYVMNGGSFMMIGGFMSFTGIEGKAHYGTTAISEILPVKLLPFDDRVETPEGTVPEILEKNHPIFKGITGEWPYLIGHNKTIGAPEVGQVIARVQEDPFIAIGEFGKGRSAVFTSDCAPHWASPKFLEWDGYNKIFTNLADWLTEKR